MSIFGNEFRREYVRKAACPHCRETGHEVLMSAAGEVLVCPKLEGEGDTGVRTFYPTSFWLGGEPGSANRWLMAISEVNAKNLRTT